MLSFGFVSGHDFGLAVERGKKVGLLAPEGDVFSTERHA
jgi:hypothetical protein